MVRLIKSGKPISGSGARNTIICCRFGSRHRVCVPGSKRDADIVANAADDEVIADQHGFFHRAAGNHARLDDSAFDEKKSEDHPEPGNGLAHRAALPE